MTEALHQNLMHANQKVALVIEIVLMLAAALHHVLVHHEAMRQEAILALVTQVKNLVTLVHVPMHKQAVTVQPEVVVIQHRVVHVVLLKKYEYGYNNRSHAKFY